MKIGNAEENISPMYFLANEEMSNVIRVLIQMKDTVSKDALEKAAALTMKRYPYFAVKAQRVNNEYVNVSNPLPVVVKEGIGSIGLLTKESNYHPLAFLYEDTRITVEISHLLTDGHGIMPLVRTLVYYYVSIDTGKAFSSDGIRLSDSPLFGDELGDPMDKINWAEIDAPLCETRKVDNIFKIRELGVQNVSRKMIHYVSIDEDSFMKYTKSVDGSPAVIMTAILSKVFWNHTDKTLCYHVAYDKRPMLGNQHSYRALHGIIPVAFSQTRKNLEMERLCTCARGAVMLQTDSQNVLYYEKLSRMGAEQMRMIPTMEMKAKLVSEKAKAILENITASISYPGQMRLGEFEPYVDKIFAAVDGVADGGLTIEIMCHNHKFNVSVIQGFDDDRIVREILRFLAEEGIPYAYMGKEELKLARAIPEDMENDTQPL